MATKQMRPYREIWARIDLFCLLLLESITHVTGEKTQELRADHSIHHRSISAHVRPFLGRGPRREDTARHRCIAPEPELQVHFVDSDVRSCRRWERDCGGERSDCGPRHDPPDAGAGDLRTQGL